MTAMLLPALLLPVWIGREAVTPLGLRQRDAFALTISTVAGFGLVSILFFFWRASGGPANWTYAGLELLVAVSLTAMNRMRPASAAPAGTSGDAEPEASSAPLWLKAAALLVILLTVWNLWIWFAPSVHGSLDSWVMWNQKARFLFLSGADWAARYSEAHPMTQLDYPLLYPSLQARLWTYAGDTVPARFAGILLQYAGVLAVTFAVLARLGRREGLHWLPWAGILVVMPPPLARQAASQIADIPVAIFVAAAVSVLCLHDRLAVGRERAFLLAGFLAGCAAWTKNEGKAFLLIAVLVTAASAARREGIREAVRTVLRLLGGAVPAFLAIGTLALAIPVTNDLVQAASRPGRLGRVLTDSSRYGFLFKAFAQRISQFAFGVPWFAAALLWLAPARGKAPLEGIAILVLMLGAYFGAYLVSPWDLDWHTVTSMDRLLLQVWPAALVLALSCVKGTERET